MMQPNLIVLRRVKVKEQNRNERRGNNLTAGLGLHISVVRIKLCCSLKAVNFGILKV